MFKFLFIFISALVILVPQVQLNENEEYWQLVEISLRFILKYS